MASGMAKGSPDLKAHPEAPSLDHTERPALLLDQEVTVRRQSRQKRFLNRARSARLRHDARCENYLPKENHDEASCRKACRARRVRLGPHGWRVCRSI
jgi:hypothetical protein